MQSKEDILAKNYCMAKMSRTWAEAVPDHVEIWFPIPGREILYIALQYLIYSNYGPRKSCAILLLSHHKPRWGIR